MIVLALMFRFCVAQLAPTVPQKSNVDWDKNCSR